VSLVGPTGSGKSQLLADIECAARGDTPTGRRVLFDGKELRDEQRFSLGNRLVAQLTQNMNFVMDSPVEDFLRLHARSRMMPEADAVIARCLETANALSGEPFEKDTRLTRLSGGQARALMIADAACISPSPILLIDEIENAGIDRVRAVELLTGGDKIVLLATHDPLLALSAGKRIVLHNGGIRAVLETNEEESEALRKLREADLLNTSLRRAIRAGERIVSHVGNV
jgi:ABC-type lipoprotein export system ATPase subunit